MKNTNFRIDVNNTTILIAAGKGANYHLTNESERRETIRNWDEIGVVSERKTYEIHGVYRRYPPSIIATIIDGLLGEFNAQGNYKFFVEKPEVGRNYVATESKGKNPKRARLYIDYGIQIHTRYPRHLQSFLASLLEKLKAEGIKIEHGPEPVPTGREDVGDLHTKVIGESLDAG